MAKFVLSDRSKVIIADKEVQNFCDAIKEVIAEPTDPCNLTPATRESRKGTIGIYALPGNVFSDGFVQVTKYTTKRLTFYKGPWEDIYFLLGQVEATLGIEEDE